jgi:protein-disulfide isomerase
MITTRLLGTLFGAAVLNFQLTTCHSPGESENSTPKTADKPKLVELPGVNTSDLTPREKTQWSQLVSEMLAPCEGTAGTVAECVQAKKSCGACVPAASYLVEKVRAGLTKPQVEASYRARFAADQVKPIALEGSPSMGPPDAAVTIVEWADFECPACRAAFPVVEAFLKKNPDVRFVFKNFPLEMHQNAESAARSAMAADRQGKFWEMHHALFSSAEPLTAAQQTGIAKQLGLDLKQFEKDQRSEVVADAVSRDKKQGRDVELSGTPTIYINGRYFTFNTDLERELSQWVTLERTLLGKSAPVAPAKAN